MTQCLVNPLCLFLLVWSAAITLYVGGVFVGTFPSPLPLTVGVFVLNIGTFCLGYLTWSLVESLSPPSAGRAASLAAKIMGGHAAGRPFTRDRLARALQFTLLMGLTALLMALYRVAVLATHANVDWFYLVTHPMALRIRLVTFIAAGVSQTSYAVMLMSLTSSLFSIGFILLGLFLHVDRTRWKYFYLLAFLFISLAMGLLHLSRYEVTANILFLVFAYCFMHARDLDPMADGRMAPLRIRNRHAFSGILVPIAAIALLFLAIDLLLRKSTEFAHANRLQGFAYHLFWYMAAPLAALNEFLTSFSGHYGLGQNTFFPIYKWLCRFHLAQEIEISFYGDKVLIPYMANVYTYLRNFYADFGIWGVTIVPYLLGGATAALRRPACRYFPFLNLYLVLLLVILFSFYNSFLSSTQNYLQILFGFVFFRYEIQGGEPESFDSRHRIRGNSHSPVPPQSSLLPSAKDIGCESFR